MGFFGGGGSAGGIGGSTGATDNAILRADGTGGATVQNSGMVIDDAVTAFSCTGDASTDTITAVGHNFAANQPVRFLTLTGGQNLDVGTVYFVRDISGDTFKVSGSSGGSVRDFTTNITAGTVVATQPNTAISNTQSDANASICITPKGTGAFVVGPKPDSTATGGNARGSRAQDVQISRDAASQIASGTSSFCAGAKNTASGVESCAIGNGNTASGNSSFATNQQTSASVSGSSSFGAQSSATRINSMSIGCGTFSGASGEAQKTFATLRCKTTTNSAVEMFVDGLVSRFGIPSGRVVGMTIQIIGSKSDGSAVAHYVRQYALKNVTGTTSEVYAPVTIGTDNAAGTSITLSANDTNDALKIEATGITSETWRWVASVDAVEVAYGT